ncbi:hypothetical protein B0J14DRAFT_83839, partial [Halenospora varia]
HSATVLAPSYFLDFLSTSHSIFSFPISSAFCESPLILLSQVLVSSLVALALGLKLPSTLLATMEELPANAAAPAPQDADGAPGVENAVPTPPAGGAPGIDNAVPAEPAAGIDVPQVHRDIDAQVLERFGEEAMDTIEFVVSACNDRQPAPSQPALPQNED